MTKQITFKNKHREWGIDTARFSYTDLRNDA